MWVNIIWLVALMENYWAIDQKQFSSPFFYIIFETDFELRRKQYPLETESKLILHGVSLRQSD